MIGAVGSRQKADIARAHGCDHIILYREEDMVERVKAITDGEGGQVVYDGVAGELFEKSLDCLAGRGLMCVFGAAGGPAADITPLTLSAKGGLFLTRPSLSHYTRTRDEALEACDDLFGVVQSAAVKIKIGRTWPLAEAAIAHRMLDARKTTGSTALIP